MRFSKFALFLVPGLVCVAAAGGFLLISPALDGPGEPSAVESASSQAAAEHVHLASCNHPHDGASNHMDDQAPGNLLDFTDAPQEMRENLQFCFSADASPEDIEFYHNLIFGDVDARYFISGRWCCGQGTPRHLTWSLVPDGTNITDSTGGSSTMFSQLDSQFSAQGGRATWVNRIQQSFDRWEALSGLSFTRITVGGNDWDDGASWPGSSGSATRGDIRIAGRSFTPTGVLAYAYLPFGGGDILLNLANNMAGSLNQHRFFRNIVMHELGHSFGLLHICSGNAAYLMEPFIQTSFDGPRHDDIRGIQRHYGDPLENDNSPAAATHVGVVEEGSPIFVGTLPPPTTGLNPPNTSLISLDGGAKVDFFRFTVNGPHEATVTIAPQGFTYDNQQQLGNGSCPGCCNNINSLAFGNLNVQIFDTDGTTVLGTGDSAPAGSAETLADVLLPTAGDYYVRVYAGNTNFVQTQLYTLNLSVVSACEDPIIDPLPDDSTVCSAAYTSALPSASGTPPLTWSLDGSEPAGMTIDSATGKITWLDPDASPSGYDITLVVETDCGTVDTQAFHLAVMPGDFDGDGEVTMLDIPDFVDHLLGLSSATPCAADVNMDGDVDARDIQWFIDALPL